MSTFTRKRKVLVGSLLAGILAAASVFGAVVALNNGDDGARDRDNGIEPPPAYNGNDEPIGHVPGVPAPPVAAYSGFHQARLDLAERLGIDPARIELTSIQHAGFDGCLGIEVEGQACTQQLISATVALFQAEGETYRYHIGGEQIIATDFVDGEVTDGVPLDDELRPDTNAYLAAYARGDLAIRLGVDVEAVTVEMVQPVTFPNLCLGFEEHPGQMCAEAIAEGAIVVASHGGESYRYHVSEHGMVGVSFKDGEVTVDIDESLAGLHDDLRGDLADRLDVEASAVSILSFRNVQWPDGCLGVYEADAACTQAIVPGFLAVLGVAGENTGYVYHGADEHFIAVSFLDPEEVEISLPIAYDVG